MPADSMLAARFHARISASPASRATTQNLIDFTGTLYPPIGGAASSRSASGQNAFHIIISCCSFVGEQLSGRAEVPRLTSCVHPRGGHNPLLIPDSVSRSPSPRLHGRVLRRVGSP